MKAKAQDLHAFANPVVVLQYEPCQLCHTGVAHVIEKGPHLVYCQAVQQVAGKLLSTWPGTFIICQHTTWWLGPWESDKTHCTVTAFTSL